MKPTSLALSLLIAATSKTVNIDAFTPLTTTFTGAGTNVYSYSRPFASLYQSNQFSANELRNIHTYLSAGFLGQDEDDDGAGLVSDDKYVQKLSDDERKENLQVMKQIFRNDLADLQRRRDYAGWLEAKKDLKKRQAADPWFELNDLMKDAVQMDEMEEAARLKVLIEKVSLSECYCT